MSYGTLPSKMLHAVDTWPSPRAQVFRTAQGWQNISSEEFLRRTAGLAQAFFELGVKAGDRIGLFCANRPEWHTADFAINGNGAATALTPSIASRRITFAQLDPSAQAPWARTTFTSFEGIAALLSRPF